MRILVGINPKNHILLLRDEVQGLCEAGFECRTVRYGRKGHSSGNKLSRLHDVMVNAVKMIRTLYKFPPDILYLNSRLEKLASARDFITLFLIRCCYYRKMKIIIKSHGSDPSVLIGSSFLYKWIIIPFLVKNVDGWFFLSQKEKETIRDYNPEMAKKIFITSNIVEPTRFTPSEEFRKLNGLDEEKFRVLFIGRMIHKKGVFEIIRAMRIVKSLDALQFIFVGDGEDLAGMKQMVADMQLSEKVRFFGWMEEHEADRFYANADLLVFPTYDDEGFPMALFKSIAAGLPVITTKTRAAIDHLRSPENVLWVDPKSEGQVAAAIDELYSNFALRKSMKENNIRLALEFSREKVCAGMAADFESLFVKRNIIRSPNIQKRILLSAFACSPIRGSEPGNGWIWALTLAQQGFEVYCMTNVEDQLAIEEARKQSGLNNLHFVIVSLPLGLDKYLLDTSSKTIYLHYLLWQRKALSVARKLQKQQPFDVIHHVTFGSLQLATYLWKIKGPKFILGPVGGGQKAMKEFKSYFGSSWKVEMARNWVSYFLMHFSSNLKHMIRRADHILVTNRDTEEMVMNSRYAVAKKIHIELDNAVPLAMQDLAYPQKNGREILHLLWVGRMLPRKGLKLLLHAISKLPPDLNYDFTIVGGGEQFDLLHEWIKYYGIDPARLHIVGQIPFSEVSSYYERSDIFLFCSLRDSCGAQISEAMAFGLPVIALNIHGSALAVPDDCGIKIDPTDAEKTASGIADAILKFAKDRNFLLNCSKNAYAFAKQNSWKQRIAKITESFY